MYIHMFIYKYVTCIHMYNCQLNSSSRDIIFLIITCYFNSLDQRLCFYRVSFIPLLYFCFKCFTFVLAFHIVIVVFGLFFTVACRQHNLPCCFPSPLQLLNTKQWRQLFVVLYTVKFVHYHSLQDRNTMLYAHNIYWIFVHTYIFTNACYFFVCI